MKKILYYAIALLLGIMACAESEIETWKAKPRVWFTKANDTIIFSFYSQPAEITEYTVEIPISMAGPLSDKDRVVKVEDLGNADPESKYEFIAMIPAGEKTGVLQVTVQKTGNLSVKEDTLGFKICVSDDFEEGLEEYLNNTLVISSKLARPSWWNESSLGYYSNKKMEIIYAVPGVFELLNSDGYLWWDAEIQVAIYKLNKYCRENNIKYNPSDENVITFAYNSK
ncbi:DUF4843 domain-containing protein [Butyricimonas faecalis]|mgnify:FL=1|uniref:DUF4843 domain-containing protein n=1 Tax=Butyricimonas faecalis TaxID=2093856 RepID=A0A3S9VSN3_9BACT|nr:DUF4843 domain-containing protein [Butyricimonas faecalis]AZS29565.1 DUF4843 domain-containing protein [Butyricimonas faecalis]